MYKDSFSLLDLVHTENSELFYNDIKFNRIVNPDYTKVYSINLPNGGRRWFQDRSFQLPVVSDMQYIIAGCGLCISDKGEIDSDQENISEKLDMVIMQFYQILSSLVETEESSPIIHNQDILKKLSKREREIFILFIQGKTISQVAETIHLSARTVERYLTNLKSKLLCESKSELIMKAIENGWMSIKL